ncbi:MAG: hypothetical protein QGI34_04055 [Candidatus Latescibacteria bacterium]|nr:hypothetical protein [Candidatus Latescibacterota bacterium]
MKAVIAREPGTEVIFTDMTEPVPGEPDARRILDSGGFDISIETVGSPDGLQKALILAGSKGVVYVYGVCGDDDPFQQEILARNNVKQAGATEGRIQQRLVNFIETGQVDLNDWVSHVLPLSACQEGFDLVREKKRSR